MSKIKKIFIQGPISPEFVAKSIGDHAHKTKIGGHSIFLGQVRADEVNDQIVSAIEYTSHIDLAEEKMANLREEVFTKFEISCLHVYHSLGLVEAGQLCFFVFTSSKHRKEAMDACEFLVEQFKKNIPVWGKEILDNEEHVWKKNQ